MLRAKLYSGIVILSLAALLAAGCDNITVTPTPTPEPTTPNTGVVTTPPTGTVTQVTEEESRIIAEKYVRSCRTFVFDGIQDSLKLVKTETLRCPFCWQFTFEFDCRHAGYGDRTGQVLAEVITPHKALITVMQGEVTYAVIDGKWDIIKQALLRSE